MPDGDPKKPARPLDPAKMRGRPKLSLAQTSARPEDGASGTAAMNPPSGQQSGREPSPEPITRPLASRPSPVPLMPPLPQLRPDYKPPTWVEPEAKEPEARGPEAKEPVDSPEPASIDNVPPLPRVASRRPSGILLSFLLMVLLPTALLGGYYWFIASDQYVAEFRFSVTESAPALPGSGSASVGTTQQGQGSGVSALASMLGGSASSPTPAAPQNFIIIDYLLSGQACADLQKRINIKSLYARPQIDWWNRFNPARPLEKFARYFSWHLSADYDQVTGIAVVKVTAFTPHDAWLIGTTMVTQTEELINQINVRANQDAVRFAEAEVRNAKEAMSKVEAAMLGFRSSEGTVNPTTSVVSTNTQLVLTLQSNLISLQRQLASAIEQHLDRAPGVQSLKAQIAAAKQQLEQVESQVAHDKDGTGALARVVGSYDRLAFDQQFAEKMLAETMQALELARANAAAQHLYLQPYVTPAMPESSTYPHRPMDTLLGFLGFLGVWLAGLLIVRAVQDHAV